MNEDKLKLLCLQEGYAWLQKGFRARKKNLKQRLLHVKPSPTHRSAVAGCNHRILTRISAENLYKCLESHQDATHRPLKKDI